LFNDCSCLPINGAPDTSCDCPNPLIPCSKEWRYFTQNPLTLTETNSSECDESITNLSPICTNQLLCWLHMTVCNGIKDDDNDPDPIKPKYDVCESPLPNGKRSRLYVLKGKNCNDDYCGESDPN
jgi:hypothetical protein